MTTPFALLDRETTEARERLAISSSELRLSPDLASFDRGAGEPANAPETPFARHASSRSFAVSETVAVLRTAITDTATPHVDSRLDDQ